MIRLNVNKCLLMRSFLILVLHEFWSELTEFIHWSSRNLSLHFLGVMLDSLSELLHKPVADGHVVYAVEGSILVFCWFLISILRSFCLSLSCLIKIWHSGCDVHNSPWKIVSILIEVTVEWRESWPAIVIPEAIWTHKVRSLIFINWLVVIEGHNGAGTLRAVHVLRFLI